MSTTRVSRERWQQAQHFEAGVWERRERGWRGLALSAAQPLLRLAGSARGRRDDWNHWWARHFEGYRHLPAVLDNFIELGCGPYTNTRLILQGRQAKHVVCSDPLARTYVRFRFGWLGRQYRKAAVLVDDHPIEECPFASDYFDAVVMINVLDHVMDADACLRQAVRITRPGGFLVIGQDLTNDEDLQRVPYDVGHPIRLHGEELDAHLPDFEPLIHKRLNREEGRCPEGHYATLIYLGRKR
jgi:SAM-dependent methyltransferase